MAIVYDTLLLPYGRGRLLQPHGRVFAWRSSDLGMIPGWDSFKYFRSTTQVLMTNIIIFQLKKKSV